MSIRDLIDEEREAFVADPELAPSREITYILKSDPSNPLTLNAFVGAGLFSKEEKEKIGSFQSFGSLKLANKPVVGDQVEYDEVTYKVVRYTKLGSLYTAFGEATQHNTRSSNRPRT